MDKQKESIWLVGFFRFHKKGPDYGFERMHLQSIWKTEEDARKHMSFCDEAGWYEGVLIEQRAIGHEYLFQHERKRVWLIQQEDATLKEIPEHEFYKCVGGLIG